MSFVSNDLHDFTLVYYYSKLFGNFLEGISCKIVMDFVMNGDEDEDKPPKF